MPLYQKAQTQELIPWDETVDMLTVSIAPADAANGSPILGDMIAVNANDPNDRWLVSKARFEANYVLAVEPTDPYDHSAALLLEEQRLRWRMELIARVTAHTGESLAFTANDLITAEKRLIGGIYE